MLETIDRVLITGASGGIGEAFARRLASLGKHLILVARREDRLRSLAEELATEHGVDVLVLAADLAEPNSAERLFAETERQGLDVDLLINNAGFGKSGEFSDLTLDLQADMVRLNVNTLMELTRLYLPSMRRRRRGGVINLGSTASFQPVPFMAVYAATKAFVLSFSEALAEEVAADGVTVMALCPGATGTSFWTTVGIWEDARGSMPVADDVVMPALRAFDRHRRVFVHGGLNKVISWFAGLGPRRLITHFAGRVIHKSL